MGNQQSRRKPNDKKPDVIHVVVRYCGAWGAAKYFNSLKVFLEKSSFAAHIKVVDKRDMVASQRFDVVIKETKQIIYSKTRDKSGWPSGLKKKELIAERIQAALDEISQVKEG